MGEADGVGRRLDGEGAAGGDAVERKCGDRVFEALGGDVESAELFGEGGSHGWPLEFEFAEPLFGGGEFVGLGAADADRGLQVIAGRGFVAIEPVSLR